MSDVAPTSNPIEFKAIASFEVDGALVAGTWLSRRSYQSVLVEPLEDPNVGGAWTGLYRIVATPGEGSTNKTVILVCDKSALVIGDTKAV